MASPQPSQSGLGKRKIDDGPSDDEDEGLFMSDDESAENVSDADNYYDETKEEYPKCAAYDPRYSSIKSRVDGLCMDISEMLQRSGCSTESVLDMLARVAEVSCVPETKRPIIGLLAAAGEGKSSLVNSCSDIPNLARAIDAGQSCTYVSMLYHNETPGQTKSFSAKVEFFPLDVIGTLLSEALDDWHTWHFEENRDWTPEQMEQYQRKAATSLSTFRAIYAKHAYFSTETSARRALDTMVQSGIKREAEMRMLVKLAEGLLETMRQEDGQYALYFQADAQDGLGDLLDPYISECIDENQASLWPFVKQVHVGVKGSRIFEKFTIVDLPGISDTNQVRVRATYENIDRCDYVWILSHTGRIITDTVVDGLLQRYGRIHDDSLVIVATKSDENVDHALAMDMRRRGHLSDKYKHLKECSNDIRKEVKTLSRAKDRSRQAPMERMILLEKIDKRTKTLHTIDSQWFSLIVQARNKHVTSSLLREKRHHLADSSALNVFCVSNRHYAVHKGDAEVSGSLLEPHDTNIPAVREFALKLAAPMALQSLDDFISHGFSAFLQGLGLWIDQSWIDGKEELLVIVQAPAGMIEGMLKSYIETITSSAQQDIAATLNQQLDAFISCGLTVLQGLSAAAWPTLAAFIRKDGNHSTPSMSKRSWNQQFSVAACRAIMDIVPPFQEKQAALLTEMRDRLVAAVKGVPVGLRAEHDRTAGLPMKTFERAIDANVRGIEVIFRESQVAMRKQWKRIKVNATHERDTNYFHKAMERCYRTCVQDGGPGVKGRFIATFRFHLSSRDQGSPFDVLANKIHEAVVDATETQAVALHSNLSKLFRQIDRQFDDMIIAKKVDRSEIPVRSAVRQFLVEANPKFEAIKQDLEDLKHAYGV